MNKDIPNLIIPDVSEPQNVQVVGRFKDLSIKPEEGVMEPTVNAPTAVAGRDDVTIPEPREVRRRGQNEPAEGERNYAPIERDRTEFLSAQAYSSPVNSFANEPAIGGIPAWTWVNAPVFNRDHRLEQRYQPKPEEVKFTTIGIPTSVLQYDRSVVPVNLFEAFPDLFCMSKDGGLYLQSGADWSNLGKLSSEWHAFSGFIAAKGDYWFDLPLVLQHLAGDLNHVIDPFRVVQPEEFAAMGLSPEFNIVAKANELQCFDSTVSKDINVPRTAVPRVLLDWFDQYYRHAYTIKEIDPDDMANPWTYYYIATQICDFDFDAIDARDQEVVAEVIVAMLEKKVKPRKWIFKVEQVRRALDGITSTDEFRAWWTPAAEAAVIWDANGRPGAEALPEPEIEEGITLPTQTTDAAEEQLRDVNDVLESIKKHLYDKGLANEVVDPIIRGIEATRKLLTADAFATYLVAMENNFKSE